MAGSVNKVILVGNLGRDPEIRSTQGGSRIANLSLATSETWRDRASGERKERTEWHRVKIFGRLAEIANEYLKKGRQVYIEGSIRTDKFTGKDGVEKYFTDIIANNMQLLGTGGEGGGGGGGNYQRSQGGSGGQRQGSGGHRDGPRGDDPGSSASSPPAPADDGFTDDEIPF